MKQLIYFTIALLLSACASTNRLTSPKPIAPKTNEWDVGLTTDPVWLTELLEDEVPFFAFEPVIGFRRGIHKNYDVGIRLHGLYFPQLVIDFKHVLYNKNDFYISGDFALMGGFVRTIGPQYDLLFGKEKFYGIVGLNWDITAIDASLYYNFGIGGKNIGQSKFGWQINYNVLQYNFHPAVTHRLKIGLNYTFPYWSKKKKSAPNQL